MSYDEGDLLCHFDTEEFLLVLERDGEVYAVLDELGNKRYGDRFTLYRYDVVSKIPVTCEKMP